MTRSRRDSIGVVQKGGFSPRTDGGNGGDDLSKFELVKDRGLSGCIKSYHQDAHLLLGKEAVPNLCESQTHFAGGESGG